MVRVDQFRDVGADLPAIGSANAVGDRKIFALLGGQVEIAVSVTRGKDVFLGVGLYFGLDVVDDGDCFGRSESAVDKIVLGLYFGLDVVDDGDCFGRSESAVDKIVLHIDHK